MAETGVVTILFTDLVGSTELAAAIGDAAADDVRRSHFALLRSVLADTAGEEVKTLGDGVMAAFTSAVRAVECAVEMQRAVHRAGRRPTARPLQVRVGISAGEASREAGDWFGRPVVEASRLCEAAGAGEILTAEVVRLLGGSRAAELFGPPESRTLKGLPDAVAVCQVAWEPESGDLPPSPAAAAAAASIFVGRGTELERLASAWQRARDGELAVVLLGGEPGVGKTRLAAEAAMTAQASGATVLFGRCDEDSVVPYQPIVEALWHYVSVCPDDELKEQLGHHAGELVRLVPELGRRLPGLAPDFLEEPDRFRLFAAVASLLREAAVVRPVVLVLDDLHWADKPTLLLMQHLLRQPRPFSLLIVGTYRDTDLARTHPLAAMLAELRREIAVERLTIRGLEEEDIERFLEAITGHELGRRGRELARTLGMETEGNPFFIGEILRHLVETDRVFQRDGIWTFDVPVNELGIPEGVREVIGRRLSQLSDASNRVLGEAAVLGREFEFTVLETMSALTSEDVLVAIDDSLARLLIEEVPGQSEPTYAFTHALVRQTLYEELSLARKQRLHLRAAEALEGARSEGVGFAAAVAGHLRAAGVAADRDKAVSWSVRAGSEAAALFAWEDAVTYLEAALEILEDEGIGGERAARVCERLGDILFGTGFDHARGHQLLDRALALYEEAGDLVRAAVVHSRLGSHLSTWPATMDIGKALDHFRAAERALGPEDSVARAYLSVGFAVAALWGARPADGLEASARAMELAEEIGDRGLWALAAALRAWGLVYYLRFAEAEELLEQAWAAADAVGRSGPIFVTGWVGGSAWAAREATEGVFQWAERALRHPGIERAPARRVVLMEIVAMWRLLGGEVEEGRRLHREADDASSIVSALIESLLGDFRRGLQLWRDRIEEDKAHGNTFSEVNNRWFLGQFLMDDGDLAAAEDQHRAVHEIVAASGAPIAPSLTCDLAIIVARRGRVAEADSILAGARSKLTNGEDWLGVEGHLRFAEGVIAVANGDIVSAEAHFAEAVASAEDWSRPWEQALWLTAWGEALVGGAREREGHQKLEEALALYSRLQAGPFWLERVRARF